MSKGGLLPLRVILLMVFLAAAAACQRTEAVPSLKGVLRAEDIALVAAARAGNLAGVRFWTKPNAARVTAVTALDAEDNPLVHAIWLHYPDVVSELLLAGASTDVLIGGLTVLEWSVASRSLAVVEAVLNAGGSSVTKETHGLALAAGAGQAAILRALLRAGVPTTGIGGGTALLSATINGHRDVVRLLLAHGVDPDFADISHQTALHIAARGNRADIVESLLNAGCRLDLQDAHGWTPLFEAVSQGHGEIAVMLLEAGSDPNLRDQGGYTPLMVAAGRGAPEIVEILLRYGADRKSRLMPDGPTAREIAELNRHSAALELLDR